jgi:hypothetical protein
MYTVKNWIKNNIRNMDAKKSFITAVCFYAFIMAATLSAQTCETITADAPFEMPLSEISNETKPWTRWWWMGSAVTENDITVALETYQKAGLGGVEITPIYGVAGEEQNYIEYLSPAWMKKIVFTLNEAKRLGLGVDLANASGWPFGGPWVTENDAAKYIVSKTFILKGGTVFNDTIRYIQKPVLRRQGSGYDQLREEKQLPMIALFAFKKERNSFSQKINLSDKEKNGILHWRVPKGEWLVCALFEGNHGKMVERAGAGGEGLVIDHFSDKALKNYLQKFDTAFQDCDLSYLRCFFNDSYEVDDASGEANFTPSFFSEFEEINHYKLEDCLPALLGMDSEARNRRVIYDYRTTISRLLLEKFTANWQRWAAVQGKIIRNQAHGSPANILDLYAASDIPEIEGTDIVNLKSAPSAAHLTGKKLVASETATWLNEHFLSTLGDVKNAVDKMFLAGVNHIFYHGTAYSPQNATFPGWLFYAAVHFTPQNPFWDDFGALNRYVTNVQKYLQADKASNDILLYFSLADIWSQPARNDVFLQHNLFDKTPLYPCGDFLTQAGYLWDAVSDNLLQNPNIDNLHNYKLIFIPQTDLMEARTFERLIDLAKQGKKVVFYKQLPSDVPGMADLEAHRTKFNELLKIAENCPEITVLNDFADFPKISSVANECFYADSLQSVRRAKDDGGYVYFIRNYRKTDFEGHITLNVNYSSAMLYNPMTERNGCAKIRNNADKNEIFLQLKPQESIIIETFNRQIAGELYPYYKKAGESVSLSGNWTVNFVKGGPVLPQQKVTATLESWTVWGEDYAAFSGTAEYQTVIPALTAKCDVWRLAFETVNSSAAVYLNGEYIQTLVNPPFSLEITAEKFKGNDTLAVRVSNLMANRIAYMDKHNIPYRIFHNVNFNALRNENRGADGKFTAINWKPQNSGLSGAVTLTPLAK